MADRFPALRLPHPGAAVKAQDISALLQWLRSLQALEYVDVDVTFSASATSTVEHGLGRAYRGGSVLWVSDVTRGLSVLDPTAAADAATTVELGTVGGGVFTGTALLRVY